MPGQAERERDGGWGSPIGGSLGKAPLRTSLVSWCLGDKRKPVLQRFGGRGHSQYKCPGMAAGQKGGRAGAHGWGGEMQEDEVRQVDTGQIPQGLIICGKELGFKSKCGKTTGGFRHAVSAMIWDNYLNNPSALCCCSVAKLCPTLCDPWTAARQASLSFTVSWILL